MLRVIENLPVELVGLCILGCLSLRDIVMLERACGSKKSHQLFLTMMQHCTAVVLPNYKHKNMSALDWFVKTKCRISCLKIQLPGDNPCLHVKNLQVEYFDLQLLSDSKVDNFQLLLVNNIGCRVKCMNIEGEQVIEVMEQLSAFTRNIKQLTIQYSNNCMDWLTVDVLSRWKPKEIYLYGSTITTTSFVSLLVKTWSELTSIALSSDFIDDSAVLAIAQHCPKLETLHIVSNTITWTSLLTLSERGLPLKELLIPHIPNIPTVDIARRCSHALSCIRYLSTNKLHTNNQDASSFISYMTGLTAVLLNCDCPTCIPLIAQHCHKLTRVMLFSSHSTVSDILSLCRVNPLLQNFMCYVPCGFTDTTLLELIHACPHLHTLDLPYETAITVIGILALSGELCPQLQVLSIHRCHKVTEVAVLQLLQRCRKLTRLEVSSSSLSEETWTQLDRNTQKRVSRR